MKISRKVWRRGFWGCIVVLCFAVLRLLFAQKLPIQFTDYQLNSDFEALLVLLIPFTIVAGVFCDYKLHRKRRNAFVQVFLAVFIAAPALFFFAIVNAFQDRWIDRKVLYQGRFTDHQIILQCPPYEDYSRIMKVKPLISELRLVMPADTTQLQESKWVKVIDRQLQISN